MKLNEYTDLQNVINAIPTLSSETDDTKNTITSALLYKYGNRTIGDGVSKLTATVLANTINLIYGKKWTKLKEAVEADISLTENTSKDTVTETNNIYGFNSEVGGDGTPDYKKVVTTEKKDEFPDIFQSMTNGVDFYDLFSYYYVVIKDIAKMLLVPIYED